MRLIHAFSMQLVEFPSSEVPEYAILSHTWGKDEVLFSNFGTRGVRELRGYWKIQRACQEALHKDGLEYLWIDTCCIDKSSSAELSEAINSMFSWYEKAAICYAYLEDVYPTTSAAVIKRTGSWLDSYEASFQGARYFKRGWTLQELLAPKKVEFFSGAWLYLGSRETLAPTISSVTRIDEGILTGREHIWHASVAKRMSWVADRQTTRPEDLAYCLLGIFHVNLPLLYGEGSQAFIRLQEEILRTSDDQSIFAWTESKPGSDSYCGLFAKDPSAFNDSGDIQSFRDWNAEPEPTSITNLGLCIRLPLTPFEPLSGVYVAKLRCIRKSADNQEEVGIFLKRLASGARQFVRAYPDTTWDDVGKGLVTQIYVRQNPVTPKEVDILPPLELECLGVQKSLKNYRLVAAVSSQGAVTLERQNSRCQRAFNLPLEARRLAHVFLIGGPRGDSFAILLGSGINPGSLDAYLHGEALSVPTTSHGDHGKGIFELMRRSYRVAVSQGSRSRVALAEFGPDDKQTRLQFWISAEGSYLPEPKKTETAPAHRGAAGIDLSTTLDVTPLFSGLNLRSR